MKLISLNTWGGVVYEPLLEFIKQRSAETDIFCFQEVFPSAKSPWPKLGKVRPKLFFEIQDVLPDFNGYHAPAREGDVGGLAIFINKSIRVDKVEHIVVFEQLDHLDDENHADYFSMGRDLQHLEFSHLGKNYNVFNFHGIWVPKGKMDTAKRIEQSEKIKKLFDTAKGARILCGDFNLDLNTKSVEILSEGNRNLIKEYGVATTRSSFYDRSSVKFADYMIVSPEVEVKDFKVLPDEVSDHLPLLLDFN